MKTVVTNQMQRCVMATALAIVVLSLCTQAGRAQQRTSDTNPAGAPTSPQAALTTPKPAPSPASKPIKIGGVTFSGSLRARVESWDWFETPAADGNYTFGALLLRLALGQQKEKLDWQIEGAFPLLINLPTNAIAPAPQGQLGLGASYFAASGRQDAAAILKQAFVRFKGLGGDGPSSLKIGRFEFGDGAEVAPADATLAILKRDHLANRLVGTFAFSHVQRSFDGVQYVRNTQTANFTFLAARPTEGVFQLSGNKELNADFYYGAFTKPLPGKRAMSEAQAFVLHYHDGRRVLKTDNRPQAIRQADNDKLRLTSFGGHFISAIKAGAGTADVLLWGIGQFGKWGKLDHRAGAIAAEAGYQFNTKFKPWMRAGYFRSTGDSDPNDSRHNTFFQVLPTPRIYARFPFYNLMNNEDIFAQLRLKPFKGLSLRADVRHLRLSNKNDLWYVGGGAFQDKTFGYVGRPSGGKSTLGTMADVSVDYNLTSTTALTFYIGSVRGGHVPANIYPAGGNHPGARFLYFEVTQRF